MPQRSRPTARGGSSRGAGRSQRDTSAASTEREERGSATGGTRGGPRLPVDDPLASLPPTAARVLSAAQRIVADRGLSALTLNTVAEESGENKAMTKYYFGNKAGLIATLVDAAVHDELLESASRMRDVGQEDRVPRLVDELRHMSGADAGFLTFFSLFPHALRDDELRARLVTLYEWYLQIKLDWLGLDRGSEVDRRAELRPLAQLLSAVIDGMAIQTLIDPERFDLVPAYDLLERILVSVLPDLLGETLPAEPEAGASESGP